ncbi:MAG: DUF4878 domain-containing protein [Opitutales bacterium]|nr:DUF4878 domain-containing protein [Opitutales bacterium]
MTFFKPLSILSLFCCCLFFTACGSRQDTPAAAAKSMAKAMQRGDIEAIMCLLNPADITQAGEEQVSRLLIASLADINDGEQGIQKVEILEETITADQATVKVRYDYGNGTQADKVMHLVQIEGKWYLRLM